MATEGNKESRKTPHSPVGDLPLPPQVTTGGSDPSTTTTVFFAVCMFNFALLREHSCALSCFRQDVFSTAVVFVFRATVVSPPFLFSGDYSPTLKKGKYRRAAAAAALHGSSLHPTDSRGQFRNNFLLFFLQEELRRMYSYTRPPGASAPPPFPPFDSFPTKLLILDALVSDSISGVERCNREKMKVMTLKRVPECKGRRVLFP